MTSAEAQPAADTRTQVIEAPESVTGADGAPADTDVVETPADAADVGDVEVSGKMDIPAGADIDRASDGTDAGQASHGTETGGAETDETPVETPGETPGEPDETPGETPAGAGRAAAAMSWLPRPAELARRIRGFGYRAMVRRSWALARRHKLFAAALTAGALLRFIAVMGYRPASWFNDSFDYLHVAMGLYPHPIRPDGYSFLLWVLKPLHSFALIAVLQHLMGLASAVMIYAVLRRRFRLPYWGATLATVPVLFDGYQIQLEHLILSDTLFGFLLVSVITLLLWYGPGADGRTGRDISWKVGAVVGLLLGIATLTRTVGTPVLLAVVVYFIIRRVRWRVIIATVLLCALPLAAYAGWFWSAYGRPGMTTSSGIFLYARVSAFADCNKINPPVSEYPLCKGKHTSHTPLVFSQDAIWDQNSPFHRIATGKFTNYQNQLAGDFAKRAIMAQPLDYAKTVAGDFFFTFRWNRTVFPDRATYQMYQFGRKSAELPSWRMSRDKTAASEAHAYEQGSAKTHIVGPYAPVIRNYQRFVHLPGTLLGGILLIGLAGLVPMWRRWGGAALLPWVTATGLLLVPPATAEFDYRYVLPTVPVACMAAAIAFSREPRERFKNLRLRRSRARTGEDETPETELPRAVEPVAGRAD